ncbi:unnamed protein product [Cuscuta campestris]|uniref:CCHC-type domain-containing protein n=1 Tax=Cuscuta campestris TaxID=132261 RepID=A0A484NBF3_9ASTE|nr:unnamed protein product [Cuscuta campestris]
MGSSSRNLYAGIGEGQSTSRPPLFDGTNYSYWKERMRIYIRSTNFELWLVIKNGEEIPMKKVGETTVPKTENEFDAEDIKKIENYAKAINMLYCAVNPDDYQKISCCTTAKEMWDKLEVTYEGTDQVREAKIDFLTQEYEMFRMKEGEKIDDMFDHFSKIINDLHALKKTYTNKDLVRKILRSLTPEWRSKADAIYESIGVSNVTIDGLRGNLKTYESTILTPSLDEQKKKGIALKATKEPVEEASSDDDNEFGLVIKKFHKFMKKEFERKGRKHDGPPKCYGCGEIGHIKPRCPKAKHGKDKPGFKKQRAYISLGGDSGDVSTDQEEDEAANLCLMAHEDQSDDVQKRNARECYARAVKKITKGVNVISQEITKGETWEKLEPEAKTVEIELHPGDSSMMVRIGANLPEDLKAEITRVLQEYAGIFAWSLVDMPGIDRSIICHWLAVRDGSQPVRQKKRYNLRLNPKKCVFAVHTGKFLGFMVTKRGIEPNPEKIRAITEMQAPTSVRDVQKLTSRLVALSRFLSRSAERSLPFFKVLKKANTFVWDEDCQMEFEELKEYLVSDIVLSKPEPGETLYLYLGISPNAVSSVLIRDDGAQKPIYYVSKALNGAESRYTAMEKTAYALFISAKKLTSYFQAHPVEVLTD